MAEEKEKEKEKEKVRCKRLDKRRMGSMPLIEKSEAIKLHKKGLVKILDYENMKIEQEEILTPEEKKCIGVTAAGLSCNRPATHGETCWQHEVK